MNQSIATGTGHAVSVPFGHRAEQTERTLTAERIVSRYKKAIENRAQWQSHWRECYDYALPRRDGAIGAGTAGEKKTDKLFDGTAPDAVEQLAASLFSELTPPWARWFGLIVGSELDDTDNAGLGEMLERVSVTLQSNLDRSNFAVEMHQCFLDLVTAGTASLLMEEAPPGDSSAFRFTAVPLSQVVLEEGADGRLDTTYRRTEYTREQVLTRFPKAQLDDHDDDNDDTRKYAVIEAVLPDDGGFSYMAVARLARPFKSLLPGRLKGMIAMAPDRMEKASACDKPQVFAAVGLRKKRVALMTGCAQQVLRPAINEATVRLLTRHGCEVVIAPDTGCCGALVHHMGKEEEARAAARINIAAWRTEVDNGGLDAIVINASGCGTTVKDYGFMLGNDPDWADAAKTVSALARDITEVMADLDLQTVEITDDTVVAYHSACSMQHGQKLISVPKQLLQDAGYSVREPAEGHLCCGSAGTYNLLQPELAEKLQNRKAVNLEEQFPDVIATGNIGCLIQIAGATDVPVVHTVELLDWATGGPKPECFT